MQTDEQIALGFVKFHLACRTVSRIICAQMCNKIRERWPSCTFFILRTQWRHSLYTRQNQQKKTLGTPLDIVETCK
jgi:hypothetical protein